MPRILSHERLIPMKEAQKTILSSFQAPSSRRVISLHDACGSIIAESVRSQRTMPPVMLAGPDGIAVVSEETVNATQDNPKEIHGIRVNTGLPMPEGYDAVIPVEEIQIFDNDKYIIRNSVIPQQNTIPKGNDIFEGEIILHPGHYMIPFDISALLQYGIQRVSVKNWKIGMIATGDEIIPVSKEPLHGQILETNTMMLSGYLREYGVSTEIFPILPDDPEIVSSRIKTACKTCDMVLLFGGSSAGTKDHTVDAIERAGDLLFHGVAMGPGKPVSCGNVQGKPVIGMPGPSIGSMIVFNQLIHPLLRSWGVPVPPKKGVIGEITEEIPSFIGFDLFYLVNIRYENGKIFIIPMERRFGQMMGIKADAILHLPRDKDGYRKGEMVQATYFRENNFEFTES